MKKIIICTYGVRIDVLRNHADSFRKIEDKLNEILTEKRKFQKIQFQFRFFDSVHLNGSICFKFCSQSSSDTRSIIQDPIIQKIFFDNLSWLVNPEEIEFSTGHIDDIVPNYMEKKEETEGVRA